MYGLDSFIECVCCACSLSERLDAPFMFCLCSCMLEVISSFRSLRAGSQVFALLMLFLCVILHTICLRIRACNCYASFPLVCCACLASV